MERIVYCAAFIHSIGLHHLQAHEHAQIAVTQAGTIAWINITTTTITQHQLLQLLHAKHWQDATVHHLTQSQFFIPG